MKIVNLNDIQVRILQEIIYYDIKDKCIDFDEQPETFKEAIIDLERQLNEEG